MSLYRTREGDMLDAVCKAELGAEAHVAAVLDANPHLADLGPVYAAGVLIALPAVSTPAARGDIRLWGRT
ncbi:tail protein X [Albidovulum sp.]|uniref:tail protein X n=1 Tax=Albidovulum sp. TaxID=1872424 RepID=UPI0039B8FEE4